MKDENDIEIIEGDESDFKDRIKKIKEELRSCQKIKEEYLAGWQRAKADFINARKDEEKRMEEFAKFANKNILSDFLAVGDSIDMALRHAESEGVRQIKGQFAEILKRNGLSEIESAKGLKFNPEENEAILEENVETEAEDGVIIEELQKGYKLWNRVLRPAKVKIGVYKVKNLK
ncbi:MAG: nucleotide exchange factor GrpE [Patescibacteria group bacterium]